MAFQPGLRLMVCVSHWADAGEQLSNAADSSDAGFLRLNFTVFRAIECGTFRNFGVTTLKAKKGNKTGQKSLEIFCSLKPGESVRASVPGRRALLFPNSLVSERRVQRAESLEQMALSTTVSDRLPTEWTV